MLEATLLTLRLAAVTTLILLILGIPAAWWLSRKNSTTREIINTIISLPLVLPPTVLGFYLLLLMSPTHPLGQFLKQHFDLTLPFTFAGLVIGSVVYSIPFVVQPIRNAFEAMGHTPMEVAATLRYSPLRAFWHVALPLARPAILSGAVLGFAHTLGEFGVVLMLGGNIPGETKVLSIAIYDHVESLEWTEAHILSGGMLVGAFILILLVNLLERRNRV